MNENTNEIRSAPRPACHLCGSQGEVIYEGLRDRLFGASGSWNCKKCSNADCGLLWLDPMPLPEDIGKAYTNYYTHASQTDNHDLGGWRKQLVRSMEQNYWSNKYGYQFEPVSLPARILGGVLYLSPIRRREADAGVRCLAAVAGGRLYDMGCGSGDWLILMRDLGWQVTGNDFDEKAVMVATKRGLQVSLGSLEQQNLPENTFDAVTLSHVIEHVPDPVQTMRECLRILKPGGKIVLLTPNNGSLSHRVFKESWRGLEPPRHLHVFSLKSMDRLLVQVGFKQVSVRPFIVTSVIYDSLLLRWGRPQGQSRHWGAWAVARLFKIIVLCLTAFDPTAGDCLIAIATKK